jgi:hypothetical protein
LGPFVVRGGIIAEKECGQEKKNGNRENQMIY